ncbi:hypothetical protein U2E72_13100 [Acinetobacter baumannii]|uniref:hypothetical protein n=1 Tax=Acinetobacter baumannii TaxID=470 RepID=UPI002449E30D|nr:hypothetical protein [Acinetobacter baumannii]MDH2549407.1 hypothetical protein [Acinetobacter baumannii]MDK3064895.1 hypothetical protein [Acinetobacter baumannii]
MAIHVSPCPEQAIIDALKHITRDFCKESLVWVHDCKTATPAALNDQFILELDTPENSIIVHVWGIEGRSGNYHTNQSDYFFSLPNKLTFSKAVKDVKPIVSLMPSQKSNEYPDFISEYFEDYIIAGAVAYLQLQPYREWSQPNAAGPHQQKYLDGIQSAIQLRDNGLNLARKRARVVPRYL